MNNLLSAAYWANWSDDQLLSLRIQQLGIKIKDIPWLHEEQRNLKNELLSKGITQLTPRLYIADDWFTPDQSASIAIPFYLAHPRLMQLEQKAIGTVEGKARRDFRKLLRHEAGHCFDHAYRLDKDPHWQTVFGDRNVPYNPDDYRPRLFSKRYVKHLGNGYAQAHPEEDFAETFALYITPGFDWQNRYQFCPEILRKFYYIDRLVCKYGQTKTARLHQERWGNVSHMKQTLRTYYATKRKAANWHSINLHDRYLLETFGTASKSRSLPASSFLASNLNKISNNIAILSGFHQYEARRMVQNAVQRTRQFNLFLKHSEELTGRLVVESISLILKQHTTS